MYHKVLIVVECKFILFHLYWWCWNRYACIDNLCNCWTEIYDSEICAKEAKPTFWSLEMAAAVKGTWSPDEFIHKVHWIVFELNWGPDCL